MELKISEEVTDEFPGIKIGLLTVKDAEVHDQDPELQQLKQQVSNRLRQKFEDQPLGEHPRIKVWRDAYRRFGADPEKSMPTVEKMVERITSGDDLYTINTAVDAYLTVILEQLMPIGGHDLEKLEGVVELRFSEGGEKFYPLTGGEEKTREGEVVYADQEKVIARNWNQIDCEGAKLDTGTENMIFITEAVDNIPRKEVEETLAKLEQRITRFCGGTTDTRILEPR